MIDEETEKMTAEELYNEFVEAGKIKKATKHLSAEGKPFWRFEIFMNRTYDDLTVEKRVFDFISFNEINGAIKGRWLYFDLKGNDDPSKTEVIERGAVDWNTSPTPEKCHPEPTPEEKMKPANMKKLETAINKGGLLFENSFQQFTFNKDCGMEIVSGRFNHRTWLALLVCAAKVVQNESKVKISGIEELENIHDMIWSRGNDEHFKATPNVHVTDGDIRRLLHRPHMSSNDCERLMVSLAELVFKVKDYRGLSVLNENNENEWKQITYYDVHGFVGIRIKETEHCKRGQGAGTKEQDYHVYFDSKAGLAFWSNLKAGAFSLLTNDGFAGKFLFLPPSAMMLVCAIWGWKNDRPAILNSEQWLTIMGWEKNPEGSERNKQLRRLEKIFDILKNKSFISGWKQLANGCYRLDKLKRLGAE